MGLRKRNYKDRETLITADNLNDIQEAILALEDGLFSVDNDKSGTVITITDAAKRGFRTFNIYGKTTQSGTPTPSNPVNLVNVGGSGSITVNVTGVSDARSMTIATPNGLPGIQVTSGGNYTDASGKQWLCDEIDFARGVYIQRCGHYIFDGSSDEKWGGFAIVSGVNYADIEVARSKKQYDMDIRCNIGTGKTWEMTYVLFINQYKKFCVGGDALRGATTLAEFKANLAQNPIELVYLLETPIETPLSEEELAAYAALYTYKDSTTVSNNAGAWMELEYIVDSKFYIDKLTSTGIHEATVE